MVTRTWLCISRVVSTSLVLLLWALGLAASEGGTRSPQVAGKFYPVDKTELSVMIDTYLTHSSVSKDEKHKILGLISPHAGYVYSGDVAATAYNEVKGLDYETVIILGPYHQAHFEGASVWSKGEWQTPLGSISIDEELAAAIMKENDKFRDEPLYHMGEHSIEVQLPFLQKVLNRFTLVPIAVSDASQENVSRLAKAIYDNIRGRKVLLIASTDMSHFHHDDVARQIDKSTQVFISAKDSIGLAHRLQDKKSELCGSAAVLTMIEYAKLANAGIRFLDYDTSRRAFGAAERVVGYGAFAVENPGPLAPNIMKLNDRQEDELLELARQTIINYMSGDNAAVSHSRDSVFDEKKAVFVTLWKGEEKKLRGCMGHIKPRQSLAEAVKEVSIQAANSDPRFTPVRPEELYDITLAISILSPPREIHDIGEINAGNHGVILSHPDGGGVFLPKVWESTQWSKEEFLNQLCTQKAGLEQKCWEASDATLYVFTSYDFGE